MGLGVPFAVSSWLKRRSLLSTLWLLILAGGIIVNATRGAWLGLLVAGVLALWSSRLLLAALISSSALAGWLGYFLLKDTAFMQRVMDPQDLLIRFEMWKVAAKVFLAHPFLGVGHMQFAQVYLDFVHEVSDIAHFDFGEIIVADNLFLTTAAEHGLLGLAALVVFLLFAALLLRRFRQLLERSGRVAQAGFIRCCELALVIYVVSGCLADVHLFTKLTKFVFILIGAGLGVGVRSRPGSRNPALLPDETFSREHSGQR
jgi:O-antigen ligase